MARARFAYQNGRSGYSLPQTKYQNDSPLATATRIPKHMPVSVYTHRPSPRLAALLGDQKVVDGLRLSFDNLADHYSALAPLSLRFVGNVKDTLRILFPQLPSRFDVLPISHVSNVTAPPGHSAVFVPLETTVGATEDDLLWHRGVVVIVGPHAATYRLVKSAKGHPFTRPLRVGELRAVRELAAFAAA